MVEIIAHRGASFDAPENTLSSVQLAWEQQADAVEIDCRLTRDGHIIAIHDADARRVADSPLHVAETAWSELQQLDCGSWKGAQWAGERFPLLSEVLAAVPQGKRLYIEVKCGVEILPALTADITQANRPSADLVVICFDEAVVAGLKQRMPSAVALFLSRTPQPATASRKAIDLGPNWKDELFAVARHCGADGLDLEAGPAVDRHLVERAEELGLPCVVWTVDNGREARRLRDAGVRGITTNRPAWLRRQL